VTVPLFTSLIRLVHYPEKYDTKTVKIVGLFFVENNAKALYISEADHRSGVTRSAVLLHVDDSEKIRSLHQKYVIVDGTFDGHDKGSAGRYAGTIKNVERLDLWSDPGAKSVE
jgi:hypothetical protein